MNKINIKQISKKQKFITFMIFLGLGLCIFLSYKIHQDNKILKTYAVTNAWVSRQTIISTKLSKNDYSALDDANDVYLMVKNFKPASCCESEYKVFIFDVGVCNTGGSVTNALDSMEKVRDKLNEEIQSRKLDMAKISKYEEEIIKSRK